MDSYRLTVTKTRTPRHGSQRGGRGFRPPIYSKPTVGGNEEARYVGRTAAMAEQARGTRQNNPGRQMTIIRLPQSKKPINISFNSCFNALSHTTGADNRRVRGGLRHRPDRHPGVSRGEPAPVLLLQRRRVRQSTPDHQPHRRDGRPDRWGRRNHCQPHDPWRPEVRYIIRIEGT